MNRKKYTPKIRAFIKKHYEKGVLYKDICGMVNDRFGTDFTEIVMKSFMVRNCSRKRKKYLIGYEKANNNGIVMVKIGGPEGPHWEAKHRLVWERAHGAIPEKHNIVFLDGNKRNFALENLALLSYTEWIRMHHFGFFSIDPTVSAAGIAVVKYLTAIHGRLEKMLGPKEHKLFINNAVRKRMREHAKIFIL
jgi:hypothetical protein